MTDSAFARFLKMPEATRARYIEAWEQARDTLERIHRRADWRVTEALAARDRAALAFTRACGEGLTPATCLHAALQAGNTKTTEE